MTTTPPTPVSLLRKLSGPTGTGPSDDSWPLFVDLYTPLLVRWARVMGLGDADAADLVQEVFALLLRKLPEFEYDPGRSFRGWLWSVTRNKWAEMSRGGRPVPLADAADAAAPDGAGLFAEAEYRSYLVARALRIMRADFEETTWRACWLVVVDGRTAAEAAAELGLTPAAVYTAKSRVLRHLRERLDGLLD